VTRVLAAVELEAAAELLASGALVAIPTDTVYGLAARLDDPRAVEALFTAKGRPTSVPIAVLCASPHAARALATRWPPAAAALATRFWPGPLTLVVPTDAALAARVGATRGVGLRVPADATCRGLLGRSGPLAVTSANRHGDRPATSAVAVLDALGAAEVAAVLDAGPRDGEVSTVVDLTGDGAAIVREGAIGTADVRSTVSGS